MGRLPALNRAFGARSLGYAACAASLVALVLSLGGILDPLAIDLGVSDVTLRNWRDRHLAKTEPIETDGKKVSAHQLAQELRKTQRELQIANRRNEILKKALGIVSQDPLPNDSPL